MDLPFDTHDLTVSESRRAIADADLSAEQIAELHAHETEHPDYDGGRKGVKDALEEKLGELEVEEPAEGLAREGEEVEVVEEEEAPEPEPAVEDEAATEEPEGAPEPEIVLVADAEGQQHEAVVKERIEACIVELRDGAGTRRVAYESDSGEPGTFVRA